MKMKTLAMLAVSGLMAGSLAYVLPAFAEDAANDIDGAVPMQLAMGDDSSTADSSASDTNSAGTDSTNNSMGGSSSADSTNGSTSGATAPAAGNSGATSDQPAQGDDDY